MQACQTSGYTGQMHLAFTAPYRFGGSMANPSKGGANYVYGDTHAKFATLPQTIDPNKFQWGKLAHSAGGKVVNKPGTNDPVQ
jgi:hypothetical protein